MSKNKILSTLVAFTLLFGGCSDETKNESVADANAMLATNEIVLTGLDKKQYVIQKKATGFILDGAESKVLLIDIFATWCPPCQAEASHLSSLQSKYKESLVVLGVSVEEGVEDAKLQLFGEQYGASYTLVNSGENSKMIEAVATKLKIGRDFGIPLMALYKDGVLINYYQGAVEEEFIESDIKKALGL